MMRTHHLQNLASPALLNSIRLASTVSSPSNPNILITGALGQLGSGLATALRQRFGTKNVFATDIRRPSDNHPMNLKGPFLYLDVLDRRRMEELIVDCKIDYVVHFSALLSAVGEMNVPRAIEVNNKGFENVIDLARVHKLRVFCPSTIGAFGPTTPRDPSTPDLTIQRPTTIYGVTKVYMELLGEYYNKRFGVDFRSLRLPGVISADSEPGGGTTDYAVDIFHHAIDKPKEPYKCYLQADARLPMIMMSDVVKAMDTFLCADESKLTQRTYNLQAVSFTPEEISNVIKQHVKDFSIVYNPDFRQKIAESWPRVLDDTKARQDWGWQHEYDLNGIVNYMLSELKKQRAGTSEAITA